MAQEIETLEERVIRHEGFRSVPYKDSLGFWTIGIGERITEDHAQELAHGVSYEWAYERMEARLTEAKQALASNLPWTSNLSPVRLSVLVEMVYQLGINGLLKFHSMLQCAKDDDIDGVVSSMLHSLWHTQTPNRCEELAELYLNNGVEV